MHGSLGAGKWIKGDRRTSILGMCVVAVEVEEERGELQFHQFHFPGSHNRARTPTCPCRCHIAGQGIDSFEGTGVFVSEMSGIQTTKV